MAPLHTKIIIMMSCLHYLTKQLYPGSRFQCWHQQSCWQSSGTWLAFQGGDLDEFLCSQPPTYIKQTKHHKTTRSDCPTTYQYWWCRCRCGYRLTLCIPVVGSIEEVCYKEVVVSFIVAAFSNINLFSYLNFFTICCKVCYILFNQIPNNHFG